MCLQSGYLGGLRSSLGGWTQKVKSWYWGRPLVSFRPSSTPACGLIHKQIGHILINFCLVVHRLVFIQFYYQVALLFLHTIRTLVPPRHTSVPAHTPQYLRTHTQLQQPHLTKTNCIGYLISFFTIFQFCFVLIVFRSSFSGNYFIQLAVLRIFPLFFIIIVYVVFVIRPITLDLFTVPLRHNENYVYLNTRLRYQELLSSSTHAWGMF